MRTVGAPGRTAASEGQPESLRVLSDRVQDDPGLDSLEFGPYVDALALLIDGPETDTPFTIAVSGPWGAGKSTLARLLEKRLLEKPQQHEAPHITCWFNAWLHDDAPHLGAAFAAEVAKEVSGRRSFLRRFFRPLPTAMLNPFELRRRRVGIALASLAVAVGAVIGLKMRGALPEPDFAKQVAIVFGGSVAAVAVVVFVSVGAAGKLFGIAQAAAGFVDKPESEAAKGSMRQVCDQLGTLIHQATRRQKRKRRLIIFVDDLERCRPPRAVEVCEVASQLFGHADVVTVLIADMESIATSASVKYAKLEGRNGSESDKGRVSTAYGRNYLEKIVQLQLDLAAPRPEALERMLFGDGNGSNTAPEAETQSEQSKLGSVSTRTAELGPFQLAVSVFTAAAAMLFWFSGDVGSGAAWVPGAFAAAAIPLALAWPAYLERRRTTELKKSIGQEIDNASDMADSTEELADMVKEAEPVMKSSVSAGVKKALVDQAAQRHHVEASEVRAQAEEEIRKFLPLLPRTAKRILNHLRVLLVVADRRELAGGNPPLTGRHIGKWVVLRIRWPAVAAVVSDSPETMQRLEGAPKLTDLEAVLKSVDADQRPDEDLLEFLNDPVKLTPVIDRLAFFAPAGPAQK